MCKGYQRSVLGPSTGLLWLNEPHDSGAHLSLLKSMYKSLEMQKFVCKSKTLSEVMLNLIVEFLAKF